MPRSDPEGSGAESTFSLDRAELGASVLLDFLTTSVPVGLALLDRDLRFVLVNEHLAEINGISVDAHAGRSLADVLPGLAPALEPVVRGVLETGEPATRTDIEGETPAAPGDRRAWRATYYPILDSEGNVAAVGAVVEEITRERRADQALRASEQRYRLLFEHNPSPMWVSDDETHAFLDVNDAMVRRYGWSRQELLSMGLADIRPLEEIPAFLEAQRTAKGLTHHGVFVHRTRDGEIFEVETASDSVEYDGRPARLVVARDVSRQRRAERALRQSEERFRAIFESTHVPACIVDETGDFVGVNRAYADLLGYTAEELVGRRFADFTHPGDRARTLERFRTQQQLSGSFRVEQRCLRKDGTTLWLDIASNIIPSPEGTGQHSVAFAVDLTQRRRAEEALRQAQRMEALGSLAGGVAHDFNNLLTAINGYAEVALARHDLDVELRGDLEQISKAGDRAAGLTRQLLAFARRQVLRPSVLDLTGVVADLEPMLQRLIGTDVELVSALTPALGSVSADRGQLEQVIVNLVVNAREAMPEGGRVSIETRNVGVTDAEDLSPGHYVSLAISDTGIGMDAETCARVFEPFFTTKERGSGLGLATVHGIVAQSGGQVSVTSEPGRGSTFTILLPRVPRSGDVDEAETFSVVSPVGSEAILVVEDEEAVRSLMRSVLTRQGYRVVGARDGEEALSRFRAEGPIDLVISDVVMPGMRGTDFVDRLRETSPSVSVIFTSGYIAGEDEERVRAGGAAFVAKPFAPAELARVVREVLDRKGYEGATLPPRG